MSDQLGFANFLQNADGLAWLVLALLIGMSAGSWYWIFVKALYATLQRRRSRSFLRRFRLASNEGLPPSVPARSAGDPGEPYSRVLARGLDAIARYRNRTAAPRLVDAGTAEAYFQRALKRAIADDLAPLERGQTFLATVASTAPFVGLFGTVWGIHHALMTIGATGNAGLDQVAGPVGEALIMTGIGLAVAIPAAVAYNAFARVRRNLRADLESFAQDLFDRLATGPVAPAPEPTVPASDFAFAGGH